MSYHSFDFHIVVSYNLPKLCGNASWSDSATTFANRTIEGKDPACVFVNTNNTVYAVDGLQNHVQEWAEGENTPRKLISTKLINLARLLTTAEGDIFATSYNGGITQWKFNGANMTEVTYFHNETCLGHFVDTNGSLYCSSPSRHIVLKQSLNETGPRTIVVVAGSGVPGSGPNNLYDPHGIFIDTNFDLYVADCGNARVQLFKLGQPTGTKVAGNTYGSPLMCPVSVSVDAEGNVYVLDYEKHAVFRVSLKLTLCIIGCSFTAGVQANQLDRPHTISFDSYGNIFVADRYNGRIQEFTFKVDSCGEFIELPHSNQLRKSKFSFSLTFDPNG